MFFSREFDSITQIFFFQFLLLNNFFSEKKQCNIRPLRGEARRIIWTCSQPKNEGLSDCWNCRMQRKRPRSESPDAQCSTPVHGSGEIAFDPNYHTNRSRALTSLWENDELCDIDVIVDRCRFPAHRSCRFPGAAVRSVYSEWYFLYICVCCFVFFRSDSSTHTLCALSFENASSIFLAS